MNSRPYSRGNRLPHSSSYQQQQQQLFTQSFTENFQTHQSHQQSLKEKKSKKATKQSDKQSFPSKAKPHQEPKSMENLQSASLKTISEFDKIPEEKTESLTFPLREIKNTQPNENTEEKVKDLDKSLASLNRRRYVGGSSCDNEGLDHVNGLEIDPHHSSQISLNQQMNIQQMFSSPRTDVNTPSIAKRQLRGFQTSVQKGYDVTPPVLLEREKRESDRFQNLQNLRGRDNELTISDVDYTKFQGGMRTKTRPSQNMHYFPANSNVQGRHATTEASYRMEFSHLDTNFDNTDNHTFSHQWSNDVRLSYLPGEYGQEIKSDDFKENERQFYSGGQLVEQGEKGNNGKQIMGPGRYASKNVVGTKGSGDVKSNTINQNNLSKMDTNPRRYSELPSNAQRAEKKPDTRYLKEAYEILDQNTISDGVEYKVGGIGMNREVKRKHNVRNKSSLVATTENGGRASKMEGFESIRRETLDTWKQDIMMIKKDMENRKRSYAEVNKLVRMYGDDQGEPGAVGKESRESLVGLHPTRKTSNLSSTNMSKPDKDAAKQIYFSGLKSPSGEENGQRRRRANNKKISFEMKTTEDCDDQRSGMAFREEQGSLKQQNVRAKTLPYYDFSHDTQEANNSFVYVDDSASDQARKPFCCGGGRMCNVF